MKKHLGVFKPDLAEAILCGHKTVESRFSISKIAPYGMVSAGDLVFIKPSGKDIIGQFKVKKVIYMEGLDPYDITKVFEEYGEKLAVDESFIKQKLSAKFVTLIFISESERLITSPIRYNKRDLRGWVVLE